MRDMNIVVLVSVTDLRKLKATLDNMSIEKMKAEKGDKNKKNKGKGKAKLRLDNSTVSLNFKNLYFVFMGQFIMSILIVKPYIKFFCFV